MYQLALDSSAILAWLKKEDEHEKYLEPIMHGLQNNRITAYISYNARIEVRYLDNQEVTGREKRGVITKEKANKQRQEDREAIESFFSGDSIVLEEVGKEVADLAVRLCEKYHIGSSMDASIVATAAARKLRCLITIDGAKESGGSNSPGGMLRLDGLIDIGGGEKLRVITPERFMRLLDEGE